MFLFQLIPYTKVKSCLICCTVWPSLCYSFDLMPSKPSSSVATLHKYSTLILFVIIYIYISLNIFWKQLSSSCTNKSRFNKSLFFQNRCRQTHPRSTIHNKVLTNIYHIRFQFHHVFILISANLFTVPTNTFVYNSVRFYTLKITPRNIHTSLIKAFTINLLIIC